MNDDPTANPEPTTGEALVSPSGEPLVSRGKTERMQERGREDQSYVSVIVKRTDEHSRHPDDVLEMAIAEGLYQINRPKTSLFLSALAAGLILGFTAMAVAMVTVLIQGTALEPFQRFATALVYPLGFVICLISGTELYTEHTATAVYPVLERKAPWRSLLRLWGLVILGNLLGALASALLLVSADDVVGAREGYQIIGHHLISHANGPLFISAMLAGWLMAQGGWLVLATPPSISQITCLYIVTFLIGLGGFHHSIAGSVEMFAALMSGLEVPWEKPARFIGMALLGNMVGGSLFVAVLNYGHIRHTQSGS